MGYSEAGTTRGVLRDCSGEDCLDCDRPIELDEEGCLNCTCDWEPDEDRDCDCDWVGILERRRYSVYCSADMSTTTINHQALTLARLEPKPRTHQYHQDLPSRLL